MAIKIQLRRGTAAEWTSANPVLMQGEMGVESDTLKVKIGNGSTAWTTLPYFTQGAKGDKGDQGVQGIQGVQGNTGPVGPIGPANTLSVGTVTTGIEGSDAEVTITGTAPNQTLSLKIPRGNKGDAATITVGTVTQVAAGQPAKVTNAGTSAAAVLNFEIPNAVGVPTGGSTGQVVRKTASATEWASLSTSDLGDVAISVPSNGQALTYDSATSKWKNATPAANLSQLGDVVVSSPADKQVLQYESASGKWKNKQATGGVSVSDTTPASPLDGDALFYSQDGTMFVRYNDGNSTQWVQPNAVLSSQIEQRYYSPNYVINGGFDINQRSFTTAASPTSGTYTADRWRTGWNGGATYTLTAASLGEIQDASQYMTVTPTAQTTTANYAGLTHRIEDVRTLAGKTVTISFYAKSASGTPKVGVAFEQIFNGSANNILPVADITLTGGTSWTRYSATYVVPSVAGKSIGANHFLGLWLFASAGSTLSTYTSIGLQSTAISFWGVQVEEGSTATAFRRNANSIQGEFAACRRYYRNLIRQNGDTSAWGLTGLCWTASATIATWYYDASEMRSQPTLEISSAGHFIEQRTGSTPTGYSTAMAQQGRGGIIGIDFNGLSSMVAGGAAQLRANSGSAVLALTAEL